MSFNTRFRREGLSPLPLRFGSAVLLVLASVLLGACKDAAGPVPPTVHTLTPVESSVAAYHLLVLRLPAELTPPAPADEPLPGIVGSDTVWLFASGDTAVAGLLPDLGDGARTLSVEFGPEDVGEASFTAVAAPVVADPEGALEELSIAIDSAAATMAADSAQGEVGATGQLFAGEFQRLVLEMSVEEKQELAAFLASYPAEMAALGLESFGGVQTNAPVPNPAAFGAASAAGLPSVTQVGRGVREFLGAVVIAGGLVVTGEVGLTLASRGWEQCTRRPRLCAAATVVGALAGLYVYFDVDEKIEQFSPIPAKPYEDLIADLFFADQSLAASQLSGSAGGTTGTVAAAGPFTLYTDAPLTLEATQTYASLQFGDRGAASGDTGDLLDKLTLIRSWWVDTRLLLEQIARDLGRETSFELVDLVDPRNTGVYQVPGSMFTLGEPDNTELACSVSGDQYLVLTCSTDATEPQDFTVVASYPTDFGPQQLQISGSLQPVPYQLTKTAGDAQTGYPGDPLAAPVQVQVIDLSDETPVEGAEVRWSIVSGGGSVSAATTTTGADGTASVTWTLGPEEGEGTLEAEAVTAEGHSAAEGPIVFAATADRGRNIEIFSGDGQIGSEGEQLPEPLTVLVFDDRDRSLSGIEVEWTLNDTDGSLSASSSTSDSHGLARVYWTRGSSEPGTVEGTLRRDGAHVSGSPLTFTAHAPVDSLAIYEEAALGSWTVTSLSSGITYDLEVSADGTGVYTASGGSRYDMTWEIRKSEGRYYFYESGFWHYTHDELPRDPLTYPISSFQTYYDADDGNGPVAQVRYAKQ